MIKKICLVFSIFLSLLCSQFNSVFAQEIMSTNVLYSMNNLFYFAEPITDKIILHLPLIPSILICLLLISILNIIYKEKYSLCFIALSCIYVFLLIDIIFYPFISNAQAGTFIHDPQYTFSLTNPITTFISNPLWSFYQLILFIPLGYIFMSIFKDIHKSVFYFIITFIVIILIQVGMNYYTNYLQYTISVGKILLNLFSFSIGILLTNRYYKRNLQ